MEFHHEQDAHRYTMRNGRDLVGTLDYTINQNSIALVRSFTTPPYRGHGYAAELVQFAVDDIDRNTTLSIVPVCWYVSDWFGNHPERSGLLDRAESA